MGPRLKLSIDTASVIIDDVDVVMANSQGQGLPWRVMMKTLMK
jgi:hypothetical protein